MQLKKIVPLALAAVMTTTAAAGAADLPLEAVNRPAGVYTYVYESGFRQQLLEKYFALICGQFPGNKPEQTPDVEQPEQTPDLEQPEQTPDIEQPEEMPDIEQPEEMPDIEQPEQTPDAEQPEEAPDIEQPEQMPDIEQPEQTPDIEQPEQTPDAEQPDQAPEQPEVTPEQPEVTPEQPEVTPEQPEVTPEQPEQTPEETPEQDNGTSQGDYASQVVALVNAERAKYGLSALKVDSLVQQAAQVRAAETVQSFSHTRPNGSSFSTALTEAGVSYTRSGENIAYGQSTPQQVVNAWMNSSGHRANILNESFTTIGVGYTVVNGTAYWAQLFTA
ncbi:CAP domain-containing protein [Agathobaculum sp. Marseille-P7918]|uniref:CAP domain-containing protein n=1 Tax=Agathobaculum sp. Marseille-P7918 TaxID=2479843 RepID=UPI001FA94E76|nr:CAP domain-containing protein [Agathobaculum sp. Marseille-P7918]